MSYSHRNNIIHGDLHRHNILIVDNESIKIIDFFGQYMSGSTNNNEDKMLTTCYKLIYDTELLCFLDTEIIKNLKPTSTTEVLVQLYYLQEQLQRYRDQIHIDEGMVQYFIGDWISTIIRYPIFKIENILTYIENDIYYDKDEFCNHLKNYILMNISRWILNKQIPKLGNNINKTDGITDFYKKYQAIAFGYVFKDDFINTNFLGIDFTISRTKTRS